MLRARFAAAISQTLAAPSYRETVFAGNSETKPSHVVYRTRTASSSFGLGSLETFSVNRDVYFTTDDPHRLLHMQERTVAAAQEVVDPFRALLRKARTVRLVVLGRGNQLTYHLDVPDKIGETRSVTDGEVALENARIKSLSWRQREVSREGRTVSDTRERVVFSYAVRRLPSVTPSPGVKIDPYELPPCSSESPHPSPAKSPVQIGTCAG
jgi:hypothetical protein